MQIYHRYLHPDNRHEPHLVRASGFLKGGTARALAGGVRINAYPGPHDPHARDYYDLGTEVPPKRAYGVDLNGNRSVREVYWPHGHADVVEFPDENRIGIPAQVVRDPLP